MRSRSSSAPTIRNSVILLALATLGAVSLSTPAIAGAAEWTPTQIVLPAGSVGGMLHGVSCPAAGECVAVGYHYPKGKNGLEGEPMVVSESAGVWGQAIAIAPPGNLEEDRLEGVGCAAPGTCVAVGSEGENGIGARRPIVVSETGGTWGPASTIQPPAGESVAELTAVSCPTTESCTAVGGDPDGAFAVTETAGVWGQAVQITSPEPGGKGTLPDLDVASFRGVDCTAVGSCAGVGEWFDPEEDRRAVAAVATGGTWGKETVVPLPSSTSFPSPVLTGVSCTASGACLAVGEDSGAIFAVAREGEAWGAASPVALPAGAEHGFLEGVSCAGDESCVAVGNASVSGTYGPSIATREGGAWSAAAIPAPSGSVYALLFGVSCASPESCVTVGNWLDEVGGELPLVYGREGPAGVTPPTGTPPGAETPPAGGAGTEAPVATPASDASAPSAPATPASSNGRTPICTVPKLNGKKLKAAKQRIRGAGCAVGKVKKRKGATPKNGKVVGESPKPGSKVTAGTKVKVTLKPATKKR